MFSRVGVNLQPSKLGVRDARIDLLDQRIDGRIGVKVH